MSRDLLYKPAVPFLNPEESEAKPGPKPANKVGVQVPRGRDLGGAGETALKQPPPQTQTQAPAQGPAAANKTPAYKAAYFNADSSGVRDVNLRQKNMQALRGSEGASDLRKVVLPPGTKDVPDPGQLRGATDLMGLDGSFDLNLESMIGRQSAWTRGEGVTAEMIMERLKQLEQMVADRKQALARLNNGRAKSRAASVTLERAEASDGKALEQEEDVVVAGGELVHKTHGQAEGMHKRIAKMLGIKRPG